MSTPMLRQARSVAAGLVLAVGVSGCSMLDSLIDVEVPDRVVGETLETPANALILMAGVVGDFECALANYIQATGTTGDELLVTDGLTAQELLDRRTFEPRGLGAAWAVSTCGTRSEGVPGVYRPLSTARWQADNLLKLLDTWSDADVPNRGVLIAKAAAYAGYSYLLLGESMCQAAFDLGAPIGPAQMWAEAENRFSRAITVASQVGSAEFLNMARVGRARTRLNLNRPADAAVDARLVPAGFIKNAGYSTASPRRQNAVHVDGLGNLYSVEPPYRQMQFQGVPDPRVRVVNTGRVVAGVNLPVWTQDKYRDRSSPIPIARWAEAQLIVAEAEVAAGNLAAAVDIINVLHRQVNLPDFVSNDRDQIMAQLQYERRAELFLEGHRFGDMKRFNVPLVPAPGTPYHAGGTYGDARCYPLPGIEIDNNPNAR